MSEMIKTKSIVPNAWNRGGDEGIGELAASIAARGLLQPIVVRPVGKKYEIVAGERRWRACVANKMPEMDCTVREIDEQEARSITLVENMERKRLSPFQEAAEIGGLHETGMGLEEIAAAIGRSEGFVRRRLLLKRLDLEAIIRLLKQNDEGPQEIGDVPLLALELLASAPDARRNAVKSWDLASVSAMRRFLLAEELEVGKAKWAKQDAFAGLSPCAECLERTSAEGCLFPELETGKDLCLNQGCWAEKARVFAKRLAEKARAAGKDVVLIGRDFDTPEAVEDGVEKPHLYLPAKKTDPGALLAVCYDGQDAGQTSYVRPYAELRKSGNKAAEKDPERKLWRKIGQQVMETIRALPHRHLPDHPDDGTAERTMMVDVLRFGTDPHGLDYAFPEDGGSARAELLAAIEDGVWSVARGIGAEGATVAADRHAALAVLGVYLPGSAKDKLKEIEEAAGAKPAPKKVVGKKRG